ncbi:MAG TPA: hypothetical protein VHZ03_38315 [Trebonia sp.]|jgi:hypothetical protein|nr:hypothetical protein [Trebonia sp.]
MTTATAPAAESRCLRCGRKIKAGTYGRTCERKIRESQRSADLSAWTPSQVADAEQAIEDGAVVPSTRKGVFHVVSVDGTEIHLVHRDGCNCTSGLKTHQPRPCWHRCAIAIVLASQAPAPRAAVTAPAPVTAPADIWAELDALGATAGAYAAF